MLKNFYQLIIKIQLKLVLNYSNFMFYFLLTTSLKSWNK